MEKFFQWIDWLNWFLWHDYVLYFVLGTGVLFTIWTKFCQYRAITHGVAVIRGKYDRKDDPGAINHFQALSAALSATVGLGNIGGVALAIALGGPGVDLVLGDPGEASRARGQKLPIKAIVSTVNKYASNVVLTNATLKRLGITEQSPADR
ncbi:sodium:alanine symporter family protein, partial [bacterium]|nr:sodium:alanine symporter family protein [bacterium]